MPLLEKNVDDWIRYKNVEEIWQERKYGPDIQRLTVYMQSFTIEIEKNIKRFNALLNVVNIDRTSAYIDEMDMELDFNYENMCVN